MNRHQQLGLYLSMGFRITGMVMGGAGLGYAIDYWLGNEKLIFTLIISTFSIVAALVQLIREFR